MMPYRDSVDVDGVPIPCHVGQPTAGLPSSDGVQVLNTNRLLVMASPGTLPAACSSEAPSPSVVLYQGKQWRPMTIQVTHRRHGVDHHVSVQIGLTA